MSSGRNELSTAGEETGGPLQRGAEHLTKASFTNLQSWMSSLVAEPANAASLVQDTKCPAEGVTPSDPHHEEWFTPSDPHHEALFRDSPARLVGDDYFTAIAIAQNLPLPPSLLSRAEAAEGRLADLQQQLRALNLGCEIPAEEASDAMADALPVAEAGISGVKVSCPCEY